MNDTRENSSQQNDLRQRVDRLEAQLNDKVDRLLYDESRSITDKKNEHDLERVKDHIDSISTGLHGYVKKRIFGIFAILLPVMAIITFFGIPTLFSMKLDREVDKHEDKILDLTENLESLITSYESKLKNSAEQRNILLASDYRRNDPYVAAMRGRILRHSSSANIAEQLELEIDADVAAAQLLLVAKQYPEGTVIGAVYNPDKQRADIFLVRTENGFYYVGPDNSLAPRVLHGLGGPKECYWLRTPPGKKAAPDLALRGLSIIGPTVAQLSSGIRRDINLNDYGSSFNCSEKFGEYEPGVANEAVLYVDRFGNCLTSIKVGAIGDLTSERNREFNVIIGDKIISLDFVKNINSADRGDAIAMDFDGYLNFMIAYGKFSEKFPACAPGAQVSIHKKERT